MNTHFNHCKCKKLTRRKGGVWSHCSLFFVNWKLIFFAVQEILVQESRASTEKNSELLINFRCIMLRSFIIFSIKSYLFERFKFGSSRFLFQNQLCQTTSVTERQGAVDLLRKSKLVGDLQRLGCNNWRFLKNHQIFS